MPDFRALMDDLANMNSDAQATARAGLLSMDEDVMDLLVAEYYAGMPEKVAVRLLDIVGEIGGYEALNLLGDVYYSTETRPAVKAAARLGLLRNADNLDPLQVERLRKDALL